MKPQRLTDRKLLDAVKALPCRACGARREVDPAHIVSVGAGGGDMADNVMPLCRTHHREAHSKGWLYMAEKYSLVDQWFTVYGRQDVLERARERTKEIKHERKMGTLSGLQRNR